MYVEFLSHYSSHLQREMRLNRYGHTGIPVIIFPSSGGSHNEYADFGMIDACKEYIYSGKVQFFTLSSVDNESWLDYSKSAYDRADFHRKYENYVIHEAIAFIKHKTNYFDQMIVSGCSMGAYHSINFFLQHPDVFNKVIALSGVYDVRYFVGDYGSNSLVYENSPAEYLWNQNNPWFIDKYRNSQIIVCTGLGAWEQDGLPSYYALKEVFNSKNISAFFDEWGYDVAHDWEWWRKQMPYFLSKI